MTSEIRANKQTNRVGLGTVEYTNTGIVVSGIVTCTELSGLTALNIAGVGTANTLDINGDIDVDGHTNLDNLSVAGVTTFSNKIQVGTGVTIETNGQATYTGIVTASSFRGDGSNLTGITQTTINNNADNRIITGSGTANTLEGEANLTWDGATLSATGSDAQLRLYDSTASSENSAFRVMAYNGVNMIQSGKAFSSDSKADLVFGSMFGGTEWLRITSDGFIQYVTL